VTAKNPPLVFVAAVSKMEAAREALNAFRTQNARILEQYDLLVTSYNDSLTEAKGLAKKHADDIGPRYGEFKISVRTEVDAKKLLDLMPNAEAAVKIEYKIDREEYNKLCKAGLIPQDVIDQIESTGSVTVYGPKEA
jgi:hypothetical protein